MPLQKSFSDQNHSGKARQQSRPQWHRNKSVGQQPTKQNVPSKPLQEKPPLPVSAATKNKLSAFQFGEQSNTKTPTKFVIDLLSDDDKENSGVKARQHVHRVEKNTPKEKALLPDLPKQEIPTTPASRLALPDLIGMGDIVRTIQETSPDERIEWDYDKDNGQSSASSFGGIRRAKKRARSSSPVNSSPALASTHFPGKVSTASTQADPGSELWGRYSLNGSNAPTPQGPSIPALAHLMHTSSPQPSKEGTTPRSASSFRRANSCGNQFPKRRRLGGPEDGDVFTESASIGPSKLAVLIEMVQEGMVQPKRSVASSEASGSSREPARGLFSNEEDGSPVHQKERREVKALTTDSAPHNPQVLHKEIANPNPLEQAPAKSGSSNYGDDDFDDDEFDATLFEGFATNIIGPILDNAETTPISKLPPDPPRQLVRTPENVNQRLPSAKSSESSGTLKSADEFGDFDEDALGDDLEQVLSQFDRQVPIKNQNDEVKKPFAIYSQAGGPHRSAMGSRAMGTNPRAMGTNPRALGTNPKALGTNPKVKQASQMSSAGLVSHHQPRKALVESEADSEDEFGDGGLDDSYLEAAEAAATQSIQQASNGLLPSTQKQAIQRYLVVEVQESKYLNPRGLERHEKILLVQKEKTQTILFVYLRGVWWDTPVTVDAYVHVIGTFINARCIIDDEVNLIILHPDHLISSTVVADSFGCARRAVLQDRVKATNEKSPPLVYGTILHEIFQAAMVANRWDTEWLNELIEDIATRHLEDLYTIKIQIPAAVEYLQSKMGELQSWAELFVSAQPKPEAMVAAGNGEKANMCVSKLLDVEEHVWSPMYGLKGNIDATVQVTMNDGKESRTLTVPFEVKTGKNKSAAHRAQTTLYNLLLSDRYDVEIAYGILYYMETSETTRIPAIRHELRHMIMQRNELAVFVRERNTQLPPMQRKENMCKRCYAKTTCFIYHKLADDGNGETSGMKEKFDAVVKHLTPKHKEFFLKWDDLITKEEKECLKFRRELWTMLSSEREKLGRCFSNVIIKPGSAYEEQNNPKINRFRYVLIKETASSEFNFRDSQLTVGEPIVISDEQGHFALANGYVTNVRKNEITVAVDRRLHNARIRQPGFDEHDNQVFASIMEVGTDGSKIAGSSATIPEEPVKYRLDKDEFSNGMSAVRNNLIQVMADGPFGSRQIRGLVVDLNAPRFKTQSTSYTLQDRGNINIDQRRAIQKVMSAEDYALVLGMPGTGKTTTIAHIIRALVSQGKSVLLASYTHSAVDNILLKLKDDGIPILRLGTIAKIHPDVQQFAKLAVEAKDSFDEIRSAWHDTPIVATSCLGINHPVFSERTFDYCIVDEASQITLPVCLGPIRLARTFVLVGDHNQLPPLVKNQEARAGGLDISLFKHLSDMHPSSVVYLEHQYRMCEDVMTLSNNLIYGGRLKCGSEAVATRSTTIPNIEALASRHFSPSTISRTQKSLCHGGAAQGSCWVRDIVNPSTKVAFVNTDPLLPASREDKKGNRIVNPVEVRLCVQLVESLLAVGVPASDIGVITHYRAQLADLKDALRSHKEVEMDTADRYQGRDKEVIILSLVRSNEAHSIGELLKDWRRINVAFTRAKTKLLVIGSRETLKDNGEEQETISRFVGLMEEKKWVYDLPTSALEDHFFEDVASQITASCVSKPAVTQSKTIEIFEDPEQEPVPAPAPAKRKLGPQAHGKENAAGGLRQPMKKVMGQIPLKPFKPPHRQSILTDIVNEALG
ncbi:DNA replication ATP-dependent helicase/nuclease DNA2 [Lachnellula suecica]|uniref:DNA replication ATP-dependent helicase/nuclease n=1 Tax=Lachnellula suecica TaxID=602035 RepID=A0A8T9C2K3_9HELO|nr:DNA replication ATP-dependent helicase/nuclease DNA2 [Lachnellula suecica]